MNCLSLKDMVERIYLLLIKEPFFNLNFSLYLLLQSLMSFCRWDRDRDLSSMFPFLSFRIFDRSTTDILSLNHWVVTIAS